MTINARPLPKLLVIGHLHKPFVNGVHLLFSNTGNMCESLPDITNGGVELTGTFVGATATYTCITGYILVGNSQRTCQDNGDWSDSEPSCRSKGEGKKVVIQNQHSALFEIKIAGKGSSNLTHLVIISYSTISNI